MVGYLGERLAEGLSLAAPIYTELSRFFALSVLLVPESTLIIGQVISESRLVSSGLDLAGAVIGQIGRMAAELGVNRKRELLRFQAYFSQDNDVDLYRAPADWPQAPSWKLLLSEAKKLGARAVPYSDGVFLNELQDIFHAATTLASLRPKNSPLA